MVDQTGLRDAYDFNLSFCPQLPPNATAGDQDNRPSIFDAMRDQLGLDLIPKRGPVEYVVVNHIDKPTSN